MASNFTSTATYSNVTRLELEQLRRADFFAGGKALTVGDAASYLTATVGKGDVNAEPYSTSLVLPLDQIFTNTPPSRPGQGISNLTQVAGIASETVQWFGPTQVLSNVGVATGAAIWQDSGIDYVARGVQSGDLLLVKQSSPGGGVANNWAVATVTTLDTHTLTCINIVTGTGVTSFAPSTDRYAYSVVRPNAVQLFAVPGSGPTGREQTFLAVAPASTLHNNVAPTHAQIMADRVVNLVPPVYNLADGGVAADRADAVYGSPAPRASLNYLGYRVVLYPSNALGTGPDLDLPIATLNPIIDSSVPADDQRMTLDYSAGVVRFSCAPRSADQLNPHGVVNATTGRLNLYAVYWALDEGNLKGCARGLYATRTLESSTRVPGKVEFDLATNSWRAHSTNGDNKFFVQAPDSAATLNHPYVAFGTYEPIDGGLAPRSFIYHQGTDTWKFVRNASLQELEVADKTTLTMGDGANPALSPGGDAYPNTLAIPSSSSGYQLVDASIATLLKQAAVGGSGTVHLRKGRYFVKSTIKMPPGVILEGEGPGTRVELVSEHDNALIQFGPNTTWGVYDADWTGTAIAPPVIDLPSGNQVEGYDICWNATRRVWGVCWADLATNSIWFNEIKPDGTWVHPGFGYNLKSSANNLFSAASTQADHYTPGHYPRLDYDPFMDMYAVVWLEDVAGLGTLYARGFQVGATGLHDIQAEWHATTVGLGYYQPSIACRSNGTTWEFSIAACNTVGALPEIISGDFIYAWTFNSGGITSSGPVDFGLTDHTNYHPVVSSTDIAYTDTSFVVALSARMHAPLWGSVGQLSLVSGHTLLTDNTVGGIAASLGLLGGVGSRFHHLGSVDSVTEHYPNDAGLDGRVQQPYGINTVTLLRNDSPNANFTNTSGVDPIKWAITPSTFVSTLSFATGSSTPTLEYIVQSAPVAGTMVREMREPDFVRLSRGPNTLLLTFQAFNSTAYLARPTMPDFAGSLTELACRSQKVYREHLGTCAVVLTHTGQLMTPPMPDSPVPSHDSTTVQVYSWNSDVSVKSLGAPDPLVMRPNALWANLTGGTPWSAYGPPRGYHLDVSARHLVTPWTMAQPFSMIPDVTWTGKDWLVVSPTQSQLHSDTGSVGGNTLTDPTFYFGTPGDVWNLYFPGHGMFRGTATSEHSVTLSPALLDGVYEWYVVESLRNPPLGQTYNLAYRVAADGSLISSSTMMPGGLNLPTQATYCKSELVSRRKFKNGYTGSTGGANAPATYGLIYPTVELTIDSAGWDMSYPTSRISGDMGFIGTCVGQPKSCNYLLSLNASLLSIAWGDNFYGLLDRNWDSGVNQVVCYRQNCGPFQSGVEGLALVGKAASTPLAIQTRRHIYTRWGAPATGTVGFATDGHRLCFVHPTEFAVPEGAGSFMNEYAGYHDTAGVMRVGWNAVYTDSCGNGAIEFQGPSSPYDPNLGLFGFPINDNIIDASTSYNARISYANPSAAKVIWNGQNFVAFWTEEQKADYAASSGNAVPAQGGLLCMGVLPGNEGTHVPDASLTPQQSSVFASQVAQVTRISSGIGANQIGSGSGPEKNVMMGQVYVCDAAYSGNTYAVLWVAGIAINTSTPDYTLNPRYAGNAIGVTIFKDAAMKTGALSYLIDIASAASSFPNVTPNVVWTGSEYLVTWSPKYAGPHKNLLFTTMSETGPVEPIQIRRASGMAQLLSNGANYIGTMHSSSGNTYITMTAPVQAGDIIVMTNSQADTWMALGAYVVKYYVPETKNAYLNLITDPIGWEGAQIYGLVLSAGVGVSDSLPVSQHTLPGTLDCNQTTSCAALTPASAVQVSNNRQFNKSDAATRILGVAYNSQRKELAVLYVTEPSPESLYVMLVAQGTWASTTSKLIWGPANPGVVGTGDISWNGNHYLVVHTCRPGAVVEDDTEDSLQYTLLTADLGVVSQSVLQTKSHADTDPRPEAAPIGNLSGQMPGDLYGEFVLASAQSWVSSVPGCRLQPRCRKVQVQWNNVTGKWLVGASYLWAMDQGSVIGSSAAVSQNPHFNLLNNYYSEETNPITGYTGVTLTGKFYVPLVQPGMRLMLWWDYKVQVVLTVMSVHNLTAPSGTDLAAYYTRLIVDVDSSLVDASTVIDPATWVYIPAREDAFLWTLSEGSAAVQVQDADSCWLSNVDISGSAVDVSEVYYGAARPTWRSVGAMTGIISTTDTNYYNVQMERHYTRSFLTPKDKIETVRLTNVRSRTGAKYGRKA